MITICRKYQKVSRNFEIYTEEEAKKGGIPYVPWYEAKVGGWGLSTDGMVTECLALKPMKNGVLMEFSGGRTISRSKVFEVMPRIHLRDWWGLTPGWWVDREKKKARTKRVVELYVKMVLGGKVDWKALGNVYRPDQEIPVATVRRLFKQKEIQTMISEEMTKALEKSGITKEFVLDKMKLAMEIAQNKGDAGNMLRGAENLAEMLEMTPKDTKGPLLGLPIGGGFDVPPATLAEYEDHLKGAEKPNPLELVEHGFE